MVTDTTIKKEYKQTKIGVIPKDWDVISYGDAFDFLSTASYSRANLSDNGEVLYIHYGDIHTTWNYFLDFKKNTLPTIEKIKVKNYSFIKDGDLIMADASEDYDGIGKSVEVQNITTNKAISGLHTFLLRGKEGIFVDGFKAYIHSNRLVKASMDKLATGLKVYGVSKTNLRTIRIPRPPLPEQTAIATILSDTDALIERLEKLIEKKKNIKQGTMQQLLTGKKRLPGFSGEWETKALGSFSDIKTGKKNNEDKIEDGQYPFFVRSQNVERINTYSFDGEAILVPGEGGIGNILHYIYGRFDYHQRVYKISNFLDDVCGKFIYYYLAKNFRRQAMKNSVKATVDSLRLPTFQEFELFFPKDKKEQLAIAQALSEMDTEIEELEAKRDKYKMIKEGMMQQLLTGKIRIHATN